MLTAKTVHVAPGHSFDIEELMAEEFALIESVGGTWKAYRKARRVSAYRISRAQRQYIFSLYESLQAEKAERAETDRFVAQLVREAEANKHVPTEAERAEYYRSLCRSRRPTGPRGPFRDYEDAILARQECDLYPELAGF
tara:strand:- start:4663 stop:5082 length:420 start_codon:yes stop_codon:yes gene_type:complete